MKKAFYLIALVFAVIATSCSSKDNNQFNEKLIMQHVYNVTSKSGATTTYGPTYFTYELNYNTGTADITLEDVKFSPMMPNITMVLKNVPFVSTMTGIKINALNIVPEVGGTPMNDYTITSFACRIAHSTVTKISTSMVSFVVNNAFTINAYPNPSTFEHDSNTHVVDLISSSTTTDFEYKKTKYAIFLNPETNLSDIYLYNVTFADGMPALNMIFKNVSFTTTASGFDFTCEELIPCLNNSEQTPVNSYPITSLTASVSGGRLSINFLCNNTAINRLYSVKSTAYMFESESLPTN